MSEIQTLVFIQKNSLLSSVILLLKHFKYLRVPFFFDRFLFTILFYFYWLILKDRISCNNEHDMKIAWNVTSEKKNPSKIWENKLPKLTYILQQALAWCTGDDPYPCCHPCKSRKRRLRQVMKKASPKVKLCGLILPVPNSK